MTRRTDGKPVDTRTRFQRLPRLLRFLAQHLAFGGAVGAAIGLIIATSDASGFRTLLASDENPLLALSLLMVTLGLTFGSLAMGIAVMTLPWGRAFDDVEDDNENH